MIKIRQHPAIAIFLLLVGAGVASGYFFKPEIIFLIIGGLNAGMAVIMVVSPVVEIDKDEVRIKNVLGVTRLRFQHNGLHNLAVRGPRLEIERDGMRATVKGINKKWLNPADWGVMADAVEEARKRKHS